MSKDFFIQIASFSDIHDYIIEWAAQEGWNPGLSDVLAYQLSDPKGFFIAYLNKEAVSCISNIKYSPHFAFLGFYIVKPDYRGKGLGLKTWQHAIQYAKGCNIGLDGVVAEQSNYQKSGFVLAHRNLRYVLTQNNINISLDAHLKPIKNIPLYLILDYTRPFFPCERSAFELTWMLMPHTHAFVYCDQNDKIRGYGLIRPCRQGYKIAPLFADNSKIAEKIFLGLCSTVDNEAPIYLDIPETNEEAKKLVSKFNMSIVFETARMYTQKTPDISIDRTFGLTSFEIG